MGHDAAMDAIAYDGSGNDVTFATCLQHLRCWRCWKAFQIPTGYGDQEANFLYRCSRCDAARALDGIDYQSCFWRYVKRLEATGQRIVPLRDTLYWWFDWEFQTHWILRCACGGRFEARFIKLAPKCSNCGARNPGWLPWPINNDPTFLKLPALIYAIPQVYQRYDTSEPAWVLEQSRQLRIKQDQERERKHGWLPKALAVLSLGLLFSIWGVFTLVSRVFGFLSNTNQFMKRSKGRDEISTFTRMGKTIG